MTGIKKQWVKKYDERKIRIIPYPPGHIRKGNKEKARRDLNLPLSERIIFS